VILIIFNPPSVAPKADVLDRMLFAVFIAKSVPHDVPNCAVITIVEISVILCSDERNEQASEQSAHARSDFYENK